VEPIVSSYSFVWVERISEIPQSAWDAIAFPLATPFLEWDWLHNLESSGSAIAKSGWLPQHLTVWRDRVLVAFAPLYVKGHSYGEFVFDHQFADLAHRLGLQYYPKLLGMSPFTPVEGYRFAIAPGEDEDDLTAAMMREIDRFCGSYNISSCLGGIIVIFGKIRDSKRLRTICRFLMRTNVAISNESVKRWLKPDCN
jgi:uncharacterized protein